MQSDNITFLELHKGIYQTLKQADFIPHLDHSVRQRLLDIARQEFASNYLCCLTCSADVMKLVEFVYMQYDKAFVFPDDLDKINPPADLPPVTTKKKNHVRRQK